MMTHRAHYRSLDTDSANAPTLTLPRKRGRESEGKVPYAPFSRIGG